MMKETKQEEKERLVKRKKQSRNAREQGITLVALVITIIIIIILATVAINFAFGDNGLITRAEQARDFYANDTKYTEESMSNVESYLEGMLPGGSGDGGDEPEDPDVPPTPTVPGTVVDAKPEEGEEIYIFEETTQIADASGDNMWVPKGFGIASDSATDIDDGVVITTADNTKQFVWIPVDETSLGEMYNTKGGEKTLLGVDTKTSIYSNLRQRAGDSYKITTPGNDPSGIREPDVLSSYDTSSRYYQDILGYASTKDMADAMVAEYAATYASIEQYDGFYIGRYELTGSVDVPTVQKGQTVLTADIAGNWYYLKKACTNIVNGDEYGAQSIMIYGNQWDEVMDWLVDTGMSSDLVNVDSSSWGNYEVDGVDVTKQNSGSNPVWQANNIYDLAGNCWEWTQEALNANRRVRRGGCYSNSGSSYPASDRGNNGPDGNYSDNSSRAALYVK